MTLQHSVLVGVARCGVGVTQLVGITARHTQYPEPRYGRENDGGSETTPAHHAESCHPLLHLWH